MNALEQGDLIRVDFTPSVGHEPCKSRPAVVVSGFGFNSRSSLTVLVPITSTDTGYPLHVRVRERGVLGFACVEQLRALDVQQRGYEFLGSVDDATLRSIMSKIRGIFSLR